jgi:hypothetical protein
MAQIIKKFSLPRVECPSCGQLPRPWRFAVRLSNGRAYVHDTIAICDFCGSNFAYGEEEEIQDGLIKWFTSSAGTRLLHQELDELIETYVNQYNEALIRANH